MDQPTPTPLDLARRALREATHADEEQAADALLRAFPLGPDIREAAVATAHAIVERSRGLGTERGTVDAFLQEFGLSNAEGVALMCLAEALLRIPDAETQDDLIIEKIASGNWAGHRGHSEDLFVNAGVWALMLTGGVINLDEGLAKNAGQWMKSLVARAGEPVIREAVLQAMRIMGRQFVFGRTIKEALSRMKKKPAVPGIYSFDMLGEGARTKAMADRYFELYTEAIAAVGKAAASEGAGPEDIHGRSSISIKISALHSRYEDAKHERMMKELLPRLKALAVDTKAQNMQLTIDAEEADRLDLSLSLIEALAHDPALKDWDGLGLAVQAYQKRAPYVIDWLIQLARETGRRLPVRLVKGAYWDAEIKHAQVMGYGDYPVWTRKATTDLNYLSCAHRMLQAQDEIYPQFASHNAHTLASVVHMAKGKEFEFQRIHGMGELLHKAVREELGETFRVRTYAPVGVHEDLLPYLVRRLLENGANSSFVNRFMNAEIPVEEVVGDPYEAVSGMRAKRHAAIPTPANLYGDRRNSAGINFTNPLEREPFLVELAACVKKEQEAPCIVSGEAVGGDKEPVISPVDTRVVVGHARSASPDDIDRALDAASKAQAQWDALGGDARADILERLADLIEEHRAPLMDLLAREGGRTLVDGISEVREAADFCRYYALQARKHFAEPQRLTSPTGESNALSLHGRGTFFCISPWNFPLAIFTGQVTAALAAGNCVLAKPAEPTPLVGAYAVRLAHQAGVPVDVLQLIVGKGSKVGAAIVNDPRIAGVALTGSTATAQTINRALAAKDGPIAALIAETGGQNVMIADSSALPEQLADDVITSAFLSAGQRCSALRVLYVQDSVADKVIEMLKGALTERSLGDPTLLATDIGPVIDENALKGLKKHIARMEKEATLIAKGELPKDCANGTFLAPHIFEIPSLDMLHDEEFGPILHVIRYRHRDLDKVMADISATGYGLTFGVHSRIEQRYMELFRRVRAGNSYINRNMVGAVVGVQPFGGMGLSGTGPKAGGPHYLARFATEKTLSINTAAIGGNAELFRLGEGLETEAAE